MALYEPGNEGEMITKKTGAFKDIDDCIDAAMWMVNHNDGVRSVQYIIDNDNRWVAIITIWEGDDC